MVARKTLINGVETSMISVHDRGLMYGHSLFETLAVKQGKPLCLSQHLSRLENGGAILGIAVDRASIEQEVEALCSDQQQAVVRITLTMGVGGRGYQSPEQPSPNRIISLHAWPEVPEGSGQGITVGISSYTLGMVPRLAGLKHGNRLEQILVRNTWQPGWQEALVFDVAGALIEATQANVFVRFGDTVVTPRLNNAGIAGIVRGLILDHSSELPFAINEDLLQAPVLQGADEIVLTNSIMGARSVASIESENTRLCKTFDPNEFKLGGLLIPFLEQHGAI